jgi:hypothetical protein
MGLIGHMLQVICVPGALQCSPTFAWEANLDKEECHGRRRAARLPKLRAPFRRLLMCPDNLQFVSYLATSPIKLGHQRTTYGGSPPAPLTSSSSPQRVASPTCRPCTVIRSPTAAVRGIAPASARTAAPMWWTEAVLASRQVEPGPCVDGDPVPAPLRVPPTHHESHCSVRRGEPVTYTQHNRRYDRRHDRR